MGAEGNEGDQGPPGALKGAVFNELWLLYWDIHGLTGLPFNGQKCPVGTIVSGFDLGAKIVCLSP